MKARVVRTFDKFQEVTDPKGLWARSERIVARTGKPHIFFLAGAWGVNYADIDTTALKICFFVRQKNKELGHAQVG